MNLRKRLSFGILMSGAVVLAGASANPPQGDLRSGFGMGPGMMSDFGMGPGMMGGYGMGPGMMGDRGAGYGMSRGMIDGNVPRVDLNLTAEQRSKIAKIQNDVRRKHWELMGKMHDEQALMSEYYSSGQRDDAPLSKSFRNMSELRQQMFDLSLSGRRQIDSILTQEQRDKLKPS